MISEAFGWIVLPWFITGIVLGYNLRRLIEKVFNKDGESKIGKTWAETH